MQIVAVTDPLQMGFARQAMVGIKVSGDVREVAAELAKLDQLDYIVITTGRFDILAELVAESDDELLDIVSGQISAVDNVLRTETFVNLQLERVCPSTRSEREPCRRGRQISWSVTNTLKSLRPPTA